MRQGGTFPRQVDAIQEGGDAGFNRGSARRTDTPDDDACLCGIHTCIELQVRRYARQVRDRSHIGLFQRRSRKGRDGDRDVLDIFRALLRRNDDVIGRVSRWSVRSGRCLTIGNTRICKCAKRSHAPDQTDFANHNPLPVTSPKRKFLYYY